MKDAKDSIQELEQETAKEAEREYREGNKEHEVDVSVKQEVKVKEIKKS